MRDAGRKLYSVAGVREIDRRAIVELGIPGAVLMRRAAEAAWREARRRWPALAGVEVLCGSGNNGGDGYELACLARADGCAVRVHEIGAPPAGSDAAVARERWHGLRGAETVPQDRPGLVVDALFGIGLSRPPGGAAAAAIETIQARRAAGSPVLALDVPSGLDADTGAAPGVAVAADLTMTFIAGKPGLHTGRGPALCGEIVIDDLQLPDTLAEGIEVAATLTAADELRADLPRRGRTAHKGDHGHALLIGGDHGTPGAILLAARAALRAGAGLVSVATRADHAAVLAAAQPELMVRGVESAAALQAMLDKADVVAIGPGLGQQEWGRSMWSALRELERPQVVDADALNLLAQQPDRLERRVLTPHPGEAARLLGWTTRQVQDDRFAAAARLRETYGGVVVLKGAGSLIAGTERRLCPYGNPGMGTGGMGDVLTGVVAALVAQGLPLEKAAATAVTAHALAGDRAAVHGERGLLPSDLIDALRSVVNP